MDNQYNATGSTTSKHPRSVSHPVSGPGACPTSQSTLVATFPSYGSGDSRPRSPSHQQIQGAYQSLEYRPGCSFLTGAPERKFGAEPIYPTYPLPPFVSPEKLGAPPMSPTTTAFGKSPTSMIDSRGSSGEQTDAMLAMTTAKQEHEDALTKQLWEQYDARAPPS
ncbi:hypothetical protein D9619_012600 [Psilocybe cf. subviscida]|uniref:Uncharacterized protein n=1 Tax=Psilocybe cf. subviscida TaxID=2480587 RepID=A0A8H5B700_9AGAR|nr:hypothetical protein D9619_012600 [Psilocybe cf. subviscida]